MQITEYITTTSVPKTYIGLYLYFAIYAAQKRHAIIQKQYMTSQVTAIIKLIRAYSLTFISDSAVL